LRTVNAFEAIGRQLITRRKGESFDVLINHESESGRKTFTAKAGGANG
jgi:hypothetical protein